jgi:hypothetical protein
MNTHNSNTQDNNKDEKLDENSYQPKENFVVILKTLTGQECSFELESNNIAISTFKELIENKLGIPTEQQQLVYLAKKLENNRKLSDYNIQSNSVLHLVLNLRKPVVLFYNYQENQEISVEIKLKNEMSKFSSVYPKPKLLKENELCWKIKFLKNGMLENLENARKYPYLFWEADTWKESEIFYKTMESFVCLKSEEVEERLDGILNQLGLNFTERCDFISYWLPILTSSPFVKISFLNEEIYERIASMNIYPTPKNILRLIMIIKTSNYFVESNLNIGNLMKNIDRNDSLVIEWGGIQI